MSRHWLARHAQAYAAFRHAGPDAFEALLSVPTKNGGVLSPAAYLEYGAQRSGDARRAWRGRVFGNDVLVKTRGEHDGRKGEPRAFAETSAATRDGGE